MDFDDPTMAHQYRRGAVTASTSSATSDGTTGVELLRAERMADVAVKRGRFTTYERASLTEQWSKYLP